MSGEASLAEERTLGEFVLRRVHAESCGECLPCALGTRQIAAVLNGTAGGNGGAVEAAVWRALGRAMRQAAKCGVGRIGGALVEELLDRDPDFFAPGRKRNSGDQGQEG
jgi:NADH:ubiquinone oxidoreductase subunit F (NADH-binding)